DQIALSCEYTIALLLNHPDEAGV
ncbi:MAG: hypothetical protein RI983_324, partial [Bacteroidota bacterium]